MLTTIVIFLLILGLLVFVHECGHFFTARKLGVKCDEFGFGFPPRICGWKKVNGKRKFFWGSAQVESEDTIYSLNWIPMGGFVQIKGENGEGKADKDSFAHQKIWKRALILSAGVTMNVVLCAVLMMFVFGIGAPQAIDENGPIVDAKDLKIQIISVLENTPAAQMGLMMGDELLTLDGTKFDKITEVQDYLATKENQEVKIQYVRLGQTMEATTIPVVLSETGRAGLGVGLTKTGIVSYPWYEAIWLGIKGTYLMFLQIIIGFATLIKNAFIHKPLGVEVAGPVGIAVMTGQIARMGFVYILQFTALLSLNLAIINFLPIPALDGGRVFFLIIEKIRGRAINEKVEQIIHTVGFALLMVLIVVVTASDIWGYRGWFVNIWQKIVN
ncbi:MAG: Membrane-associated zinc metalloprotease [Parcubacteria group bacterium GW2011_GWC2_38_7]|nr:MAG: Membrane-associated zinc metalloprotease [Parcubacteria group bacterium GW2011_GWC2_38_7]